MALYNSFLATSIKQSAGNITFTTWKGKRVLKEKVNSYSDRRTPTQLNNRARLTIMSWAGAAFKQAFQTGFRKAAVGMTEYNVFASKEQNYPLSASSNSSILFSLNPEQISLSKGNLPTLTGLLLEETITPGTYKLNWDINTPNMPSDAVIQIVLCNGTREITSGEEYAEDVEILFSTVSYDLGVETIVPTITDHNFYALAYVISTSENDVSNTVFTQPV